MKKFNLNLLGTIILFLIVLFPSCKHTELIYINIKNQPQISLAEDSKVVVHNFWINKTLEETDLNFRPQKEISQKFRDTLQGENYLKVLDRKSYSKLVKLASEAKEKKGLSSLDYIDKQDLDWREVTEEEPCDYLILGDTNFSVVDGSGYEYRRVYEPFSRSYKYKEVFVQQKIYNIQMHIILIDVNKNKKIYEDTYTDSKRKNIGSAPNNLEEFLILSEYSIERFINSFRPEYERQYRYLLGR